MAASPLIERVSNSFERDGLTATIRKCARALLVRVRSWLERYRRWRLQRSSDPKVVFQLIHRLNVWDNPESVSGPGSTLAYTARLRQHLPLVFRRHAVERLFDAPCGDFNWMRQVVSTHPLHYLGGDIVPALVRANQAAHGDARIRFIGFDLTRDAFPPADLWLCRDCLFHFSYQDILKVLRNFASSSISLTLLTNHRAEVPVANTDIRTGGFRPLDLFAPPFRLPREVLYRIAEGTDPAWCHEMCLWTRAQIAACLPGIEHAMRSLGISRAH